MSAAICGTWCVRNGRPRMSLYAHAGYICSMRFSRTGLLLFIAVFRDVAAVAVIFVWQKFPRHRDLDPVALRIRQALHLQVEVDRRHDAVAELLLDQRL